MQGMVEKVTEIMDKDNEIVTVEHKITDGWKSINTIPLQTLVWVRTTEGAKVIAKHKRVAYREVWPATIKSPLRVECRRYNVYGLSMGIMMAVEWKHLEPGDMVIEKENNPVAVERKLTNERTVRKFMMQKKHAEIESLLPRVLQDAAAEIEFCYRYNTGELQSTANLAAYGIVSAGGDSQLVEDRAIKLLPDYHEWKTKIGRRYPASLRVVREVVLEGEGLRRAGELAGLVGYKDAAIGASAGKYLLHGLNSYAILKGWGDVMCGEGLPYYGYIYVIGAAENKPPYKIGYSADPKRRLRDLQTASPVKLKLYYIAHLRKKTKKSEKLIHKQLGEFRIRGEWFNVDLSHVIDVVRLMYPDVKDAEFS